MTINRPVALSSINKRLRRRVTIGTIVATVGVIIGMLAVFVFPRHAVTDFGIVGGLVAAVGLVFACSGMARLRFVSGRAWQVSPVESVVGRRTLLLANRVIVRVPGFDPDEVYSLGWFRTVFAEAAIFISAEVFVTGGPGGRAMLATLDGRTVLPLRPARNSGERERWRRAFETVTAAGRKLRHDTDAMWRQIVDRCLPRGEFGRLTAETWLAGQLAARDPSHSESWGQVARAMTELGWRQAGGLAITHSEVMEGINTIAWTFRFLGLYGTRRGFGSNEQLTTAGATTALAVLRRRATAA